MLPDHVNWAGALGSIAVYSPAHGNSHAGSKGAGAIVKTETVSLSQATEPVGVYTTESVTHGQCNAIPTVTCPAVQHHRRLMTEAHVC